MANDGPQTDSDPRLAQIVDNARRGVVAFNEDGSFTYTPAAGYIGPDHFTYRVFDGLGHSKMALVKLQVTNQLVGSASGQGGGGESGGGSTGGTGTGTGDGGSSSSGSGRW